MNRAPDIPEGFVTSTRRGATLVADARCSEALAGCGLDQPAGWKRLTTGGEGDARGTAVRVSLGPGLVARVKQLRRGGWAAPLWGDRFAGSRRVLDNLRLPIEVARRGVATPAPLALLVERCGPGLVRAWLAVEEIEGAVDLRARFEGGRAPAPGELGAVLRLVREMHDRGVEHRDLNLGNLLLRPGDEPEAHVIDLDGARLHEGPLDFPTRQRALRRLERSYVKSCHPGPASDDVRQAIYAAYAVGDRGLLERLERGRAAGRAWIALHRPGWRRR